MEYNLETRLLKHSVRNTLSQSKVKDLRDIRRDLEQEKQTELLEKILKKKDSSVLGKLNPFSLLKGKFKPMNLLKKLGILGLFASIATNFNESAKDVANRQGKYMEELSLTDNIEAMVSSIGVSIGSIFGISDEVVRDGVHDLREKASTLSDNFINNTGEFGKALDSFFSSFNRVGGDFINSITDSISKTTDIFMKQTEEHKQFIEVVDKIEDLKGSKGYVADEDKDVYDALMAKGAKLSEVLKNDKNFMEKSGYAKEISNFTDKDKIKYNELEEFKNRDNDSNSILNKLKEKLGMDSTKKISEVEREKHNKDVVRYVEGLQSRKKVVPQQYKDEYLKIKEQEKLRLENEKKKLDQKEKERELLEKSLLVNQELIAKDEKNRDIYLKNIEAIKKTLEEFNSSPLSDVSSALDDVKSDINKTKRYTPAKKRYPTRKSGNREYKGKKKGKISSRQENFNLLERNATVVAKELGVDPRAIIAQQIQENGWKKKKLTGKNNYFNIKADKSWKGKKSKHRVWEIKNGKKVWEESWFRDYDDPTQSAKDYAKFLKKNKRYKKALEKAKNGASGEEFIDEVAKAGYATDPNYAKNIKSIMHGRTFKKLYKESQYQDVPKTPKTPIKPKTPKTPIKPIKPVEPVEPKTPIKPIEVVPKSIPIPAKQQQVDKDTVVANSLKEMADAIKEQNKQKGENNNSSTTNNTKETVINNHNNNSVLVDFKPSNQALEDLK